MAGYKLTNEAVKDLEEIWIYTCQKWSVEQADRYYNLILEEIEFLSSNSFSGRSINYIKEGYRVSQVKSHLIFYKIMNNKDVEIIRILHQSMDVGSRME